MFFYIVYKGFASMIMAKKRYEGIYGGDKDNEKKGDKVIGW